MDSLGETEVSVNEGETRFGDIAWELSKPGRHMITICSYDLNEDRPISKRELNNFIKEWLSDDTWQKYEG